MPAQQMYIQTICSYNCMQCRHSIVLDTHTLRYYSCQCW